MKGGRVYRDCEREASVKTAGRIGCRRRERVAPRCIALSHAVLLRRVLAFWVLRAAVMALVGFWVAPGFAAGSAVTVSLHFESAGQNGECSDEAFFRRAVIERLGFDPFREASDHQIAIRSRVEPTGLVGHIAWSDASGSLVGERRFEARDGDCVALLSHLAFAVVVQLQLFETLKSDEPTSPKAAATAPPREQPVSPTATPPKPASVAIAAHNLYGVTLGGQVGYDRLPHLDVTAALGAVFASPRLASSAAFELSFPQSWQMSDASGFQSSLVGASATLSYRAGAFSMGALGRIGWLSVRGFGIDEPRRSNGIVGWLGVRIAWEAPVSRRWSIGWQAEGARCVSGYQVTLRDSVVWKMQALSVSSGLFGTFWGL